MRGRPKNRNDRELAEAVKAACMAYGLSGAAVARAIGLSSATLSRCLKTGDFSPASASRARRFLADPAGARYAQRTKEQSEVQRIQEALRLLQEIIRIAPSLQDGLHAALDLSAKTGQTVG